MAQRVEQVVRHDANRVDARTRAENNPRSAQPDRSVVHRIKNGHIQLTRVQVRSQNLHDQTTRHGRVQFATCTSVSMVRRRFFQKVAMATDRGRMPIVRQSPLEITPGAQGRAALLKPCITPRTHNDRACNLLCNILT